ncbi:FAD-linked oxidoreductase [Ceratobasidium sp. AG-I]|nr:FAD-linked oxidoreductase [Ceratobasidium sp. AG-I]
MFRLGAQRTLCFPLRPQAIRQLHTQRDLLFPLARRGRLIGLGLGIGGLSLGAVVYADAEAEAVTPLSTLLRSYIVYAMCSVPMFVEYSPSILEASAAVPGIRQLSEAIVRKTFFAQFVGGETCEDTLPLIAALRKQNKGTLLAYSVEVDETRAGATDQWQKNKQEMRASVDFAGDFEDTRKGSRKTWVAIKLSALVPSADSLKRMSTFLLQSRPKDDVPYPGTPSSFDMVIFRGSKEGLLKGGLTEDDVTDLRTLYEDLRGVCNRARERGVRLIFDAEHTWYQPGIDAFVLALSREFNQPANPPKGSSISEQPLVYGTYQAYLKRTPAHLMASIQDAKQYRYSLGVKLVRGAYMDKERARHAKIGANMDSPVWTEKSDTDSCYNSCAKLLVEELASSYGSSVSGIQGRVGQLLSGPAKSSGEDIRIGLLFGTHNTISCAHIMQCIVDSGLARRDSEDRIIVKDGVEEHLCFGQLFGMRDDLTNWLAQSVRAKSPMIIKYVPYGALSDVMPYLARRAIENQSVLGGEGGAAVERKMAGAQIRKRLLG